MNEVNVYIQKLLEARNLFHGVNAPQLLEEFCTDPRIIENVHLILKAQKMLTNQWQIHSRVQEIINLHISIPNGTVGKSYEAKLDFVQLGLQDVIYTEFEGLAAFGLQYDHLTECIKGIPDKAGDSKITFKFRVNGESEHSVLNEKKIVLVINPDPKSLWKNLPSDPQAPFWKPDEVAQFAPIGQGKYLVVASKRGRSHANVGSFRDDDYAFKLLPATGWSVLAVSDGAGSAKWSRKGAQVVCQAIIDYFERYFTPSDNVQFESLALQHLLDSGEDSLHNLHAWVYQQLSKACIHAHNQLAECAKAQGGELKDLHATLAFALFKRIGKKMAILSFGVGDSPIALLHPGLSELTLLSRLDVGEFGGGTRFISMPEIFASDLFPSRFKFRLIDDFAYLMLFTDGIYDPKFGVEAKLEKLEMWQNFIQDIQGENPEHCKVELNANNPEIAQQLSAWMDFWSVGNHDDRTLAIVF